jgi:hypothetical protein
MPREDYYERQAEKLERYQELAEKKEQEGNALINRAHQMADQIPFGQPILIGHYSEKRDRNYRDRIGNTWDKGFATLKTAEHYERKVQSIESNRAVSSDAPDAIERLQEKLRKCVEFQEHAKTVNKICRKKVSDDEKIKLLIESGLKESTARAAIVPDELRRIGVPSYALTNNNGNMKRIKERIAQLEKEKTDVTTETTIGNITITNSVEENRIMITFPGISDESIRARLKSDGFRWSPSNGAWQAYRTASWKIPGIIRFLTVMPAYVAPCAPVVP